MKIKIKMMGSLGKSEKTMDVPEGTSIVDLIEILDISKQVGAVTVNESVKVDRSEALSEGDEVFLLGLVGGG